MKKMFLRSFIVSLFIVAGFAIFVIYSEKFEEFELKVLLTTASIIVYSLTGLCCSSLDKYRFPVLSRFGIVAALTGSIYAIATTWLVPDDLIIVLRLRLVFLVMSIGFAHASLLLLIDAKKVGVVLLRIIAIVANSALSIFLISIILEIQIIIINVKFIGITAVISAVATIATPIMNYLSKVTSASSG